MSAEPIAKFPTVKRQPCFDCGNPWWFQRMSDFICTSCGRREDSVLGDSTVVVSPTELDPT